MKLRVLLLSIVAVGLLAMAGCTDAQIAQLKDAKQKADIAVAAATQQMDTLQAQLNAIPTTGPTTNPAATQLQDLVAQAKKGLDAAQKLSSAAQSAIDAYTTGQPLSPDALSGLRSIPVVGPYLELAAILAASAAGVYGLFKHQSSQQQTAVAQAQLNGVLSAWNAEAPAGSSPALAAATSVVTAV